MHFLDGRGARVSVGSNQYVMISVLVLLPGKSRSSLVGYGQGAAIPSFLAREDRVALGDLVHKFMIKERLP